MRRELLECLHRYFSKIEKPTEEEKSILTQLTERLEFFPITHISRDDLSSKGFDVSAVSDADMVSLAGKMSSDYLEQLFWGSMEIIAADGVGIPYLPMPHCPLCEGQYRTDPLSGEHTCECCGRSWSDDYVLVEFPEDSSHFENNEIGYPCFNSEDNGARYVTEYEYIKHFEKDPIPNTYFRPLRWPESQSYFGESSTDALCEPIEDEKGLADFGSQAIWVPLCMLGSEVAVSKYDNILDEIRTKFANEIAEADANPDKWYEVFVVDGTGETHSEESGNTFDEAIANFERIADEWGLENTSIDIWENRESSNPIFQIK
jgi:hypothetical protein